MDKIDEQWKPAVGYDGLYEVSNMGNVKGPRGIMHPTIDSGLYLKVNIKIRQVLKSVTVHRLVAETWVPNPDNKPEVNHKNTNRMDCRADNLEWVTHQENQIHKNQINKRKSRDYKKMGKKVIQISLEGDFIKEWSSINAAALGLGIRATGICMCCRKHPKYNSSGGYRWEYSNDYYHLQPEKPKSDLEQRLRDRIALAASKMMPEAGGAGIEKLEGVHGYNGFYEKINEIIDRINKQ